MKLFLMLKVLGRQSYRKNYTVEVATGFRLSWKTATKELKNNKAEGIGEISAELLKHGGKSLEKQFLCNNLYNINNL